MCSNFQIKIFSSFPLLLAIAGLIALAVIPRSGVQSDPETDQSLQGCLKCTWNWTWCLGLCPEEIHTPPPGLLGLNQSLVFRGSKKCVQRMYIPWAGLPPFPSETLHGNAQHRSQRQAVSQHSYLFPSGLPLCCCSFCSVLRGSFLLLLAVSWSCSPSPIVRDKNTDHLSMQTEIL